MTIGMVLILLGAQLFMVKSYLLTPTATSFMAEHFNKNNESRFSAGDSGGIASNLSPGNSSQSWPFYQSGQSGSSSVPSQFGSYTSSPPPGYQHRLVPPKWVTWPALFVGVVFVMNGLALKR